MSVWAAMGLGVVHALDGRDRLGLVAMDYASDPTHLRTQIDPMTSHSTAIVTVEKMEQVVHASRHLVRAPLGRQPAAGRTMARSLPGHPTYTTAVRMARSPS